ncbi:MAG: glycosyltransferase family 25 protein [Oceanospirillaceae bacterium]|nr:glycosyltransferase family 25 protein [Oceanospirillaceae bacterium]
MKTFVISLERSQDRRASVQALLEREKVKFWFFNAIDIKTDDCNIALKYNAIKTLRVKGYRLTNAELGCFASHICLWEKCVELNEPIFILEDNIQLNDSLHRYIEYGEKNIEMLGVLKFGAIFDFKFLAIDKVLANRSLVKYNKGACGTSSYMITPLAAKNYLLKSEFFFEPVDNFMDKEWFTGQPLYTLNPSVISRNSSISTIGSRKDKSKQHFLGKLHAELYRINVRVRQLVFNMKFNKKVNSIRIGLNN